VANMKLRDWALVYGRAHWSVLPIRPRGKVPLTSQGVKDATSDLDLIASWWKQWPAANIGLAVPDGFVVVDIDSKEARDVLKAAGHDLPKTSWARTKKGWHLWYSTGGVTARNRVGVFPGVDLRGKNGYVVVPPSIHPSGHVYWWGAPLERHRITDAPQWVLQDRPPRDDRCSGPSASFLERPNSTPTDWLTRLAQPVHEGRRNQALAEVAGFLFRRFQAEEAEHLARAWADRNLIPPLPAAEVERTIDSIAGLELRRIQARR
jgi:hypothetical protein